MLRWILGFIFLFNNVFLGNVPSSGIAESYDTSFYCVHGILKARIPKWFSIPFSNGPCFAKPWLVETCPSAVPGSQTTCLAPWLSHFCRLNQYMNLVLPDVQIELRKGRGFRGQIPSTHWITEKTREFQKNIYFCFINYGKAFDCVDHNKLWEAVKEMGIPDHLTCHLKTCMQEKKQQLEPNMEQWTGSKLGK